MPSRLPKRVALVAVCLVTLFTAPSALAVIWGPLPVPPLGVYRDVTFYSCSSGIPSSTGYEYWDCLRHLHQNGNPANYAMSVDIDCNTEEEDPLIYWCKRSDNTWVQITYTQFSNCASCN